MAVVSAFIAVSRDPAVLPPLTRPETVQVTMNHPLRCLPLIGLLASALPLPAQCQPVWTALGAGVNSFVYAIEPLPGGDLVFGGQFTIPGSNPPSTSIRRWDGAAWHDFGQGTNLAVFALATLPNGHLVAAGAFTTAGGIAANRIAEWDGSSWQALGSGLNAPVYDLLVLPGGDLLAAGSFTTAGGSAIGRIARWDGSTWSAYAPGINGAVRSLTLTGNGDLIAAGLIVMAGSLSVNNIARWDGSQWHALGGGTTGGSNLGEIRAVAELPGGDLVVGGSFTNAGLVSADSVARWDGTSWYSMGMGLTNGVFTTGVLGLAVASSGVLFAAGDFRDTHHVTGLVTVNRLAHFKSGDWHPSGPGLSAQATSLAALPGGELAVGGSFLFAGGIAASHVVRVEPCPPSLTSIATSCVGPAGPMVLTSTSVPWIGQTYQASCTGLAAGSLTWSVMGFFLPNTPLTLYVPWALPNCNELASSDAVLLVAATAGVGTVSLVIPNDPSLGGTQMYNQFAQVGFGPLSLSSSNAIQLVIGY